MISALRQGKTGDQILSILDAFSSDDVNTDTAQDTGFVYMSTIGQNVPTLNELAF